MDMQGSISERIRLWLRSEQALGLSALAVKLAPLVEETAPAPAQPAKPVAAARSPQAAVAAAFAPAPAPAPSPAPSPARPASPAPSRPARPAAAASSAGAGGIAMWDLRDLPPLEEPPPATAEKQRLLDELNEKSVKTCRNCPLAQTRHNTVFGEGDIDAELMFVGEGPGEDEDLSGRPFVGRAGRKLDEMIGAMGLKREQVYIGNIVKCRPPENRQPIPAEVSACSPHLVRQIEIIRPRVIVALGLTATLFLLRQKVSMGQSRNRWWTYRGIKVMPTYHPSYILRAYTPQTRQAVWSDLQKVMAELGLKAPARRSES